MEKSKTAQKSLRKGILHEMEGKMGEGEKRANYLFAKVISRLKIARSLYR